ncbi:MAG: hypothetical protein BWY26_00041 [Elusimicrobia bacterium ADurb.Bin231]|nr:MAG: hypothetical protein BWY26_00041 [Elusimicrobia bacterium ADurb.Bin231]
MVLSKARFVSDDKKLQKFDRISERSERSFAGIIFSDKTSDADVGAARRLVINGRVNGISVDDFIPRASTPALLYSIANAASSGNALRKSISLS